MLEGRLHPLHILTLCYTPRCVMLLHRRSPLLPLWTLWHEQLAKATLTVKKGLFLSNTYCIMSGRNIEVILLDFYTWSQIWEKIIHSKDSSVFFSSQVYGIFEFAHSHNWYLKKKKKRLSLIFFVENIIKNMPMHHKLYVFLYETLFVIPNRCQVCTLILFYTHTYGVLLVLTVCTAVAWSWCSKGIFLSVIENIDSTLIPYDCTENKCLYDINCHCGVCVCMWTDVRGENKQFYLRFFCWNQSRVEIWQYGYYVAVQEKHMYLRKCFLYGLLGLDKQF